MTDRSVAALGADRADRADGADGADGADRADRADVLTRAVRPGDAAYERSRRALAVSGVVPDDRPALVVAARDAADVASAVRHAFRAGRPVTVRSGGHGTAFTALAQGALALDVSALDDVRVDRAARTARVGPGATSLALAQSLDGSGLAFPVGHKASVGLGGFLLAGGNGWNQGAWGSACESVRDAEVVLADGRRTVLDDASDPEAFAVLRGAGPAFPGVVTSFGLQLWPEPVVRRRSVRMRAAGRDGLTAIGTWADALAAVVAPEVELTLVLAPAGGVVASVTAFGRDHAHADELLEPVSRALPATTSAVVSSATTMPGLLLDEPARPGAGCVAQQAWSRAGYAEVLPRLAPHLAGAPSAASSVLVSSASYRRSAPPSPDPLHRPLGTLTVAAYAVWSPGEDDDANLAWPTTTLAALAGGTTGHYVGEADLRRTPDRLARCWEAGGIERVQAVRARLDPAGVFHPPPGLA
ncbi:FAD-binding oxidoreductase [Krasilnikoviella flava]|uniref:FAD/FMN-containing dehydrogenase n=1 Tax=Krasilnikoviella flava TaxID=526729 RepID=A0A1T5LGR2_9MICO|nr:FAD-binding protein [Krasilnikoviella flava]SKC75237.1 FAD/FMN-containing dehydrogenase [Krasilnikoviella flava]